VQVFTLSGERPEGSGQAFSPDGRYLVVPERDGYWCLDTRTGESHRVAPVGGTVNPGLAFTADGSLVLSVSGNAGVYPLPGVAAGKGAIVPEQQRLGHWHRVVTSRPDGRTIYASRYDRKRVFVMGWDGVTLDPLPPPRFGGNDGYLLFLTVSGDGSTVAGVIVFFDESDNELRVWNPPGAGGRSRGRERCRIALTTPVKALALSADGALVATADRHRVLVRDSATGSELFRYAHGRTTPNAVAFSPVRPLLASGGNDGLVYLREPNGTARPPNSQLNWKIGPITGLAFSPDGLRCAAVGKKKVVVWDSDE
jgi:outer membrane protein assembly factor BamB